MKVVGKDKDDFENKCSVKRTWSRGNTEKRTSLEDVVCEEEEAIKKLALFD